jgi:hypothetical protein
MLLRAVWQVKREIARNKKRRMTFDERFERGLHDTSSNGESVDNEQPVSHPVTCLVDATGSGLPFCTLEHLAQFALNRGKALGPVRIGQSQAKAAYCSHCYWCGRVIRRPEVCVLHSTSGEKCPLFAWERTEWARELLNAYGQIHNRLATDDEIIEMRKVARDHPELTAREVVRYIEN